MKSSKWILVAVVSLGCAAGVFADPISITVTPSLAPNAFGSPSFGDYQANAISALTSGSSTAGNPALPSYYSAVTGPLAVSQNIVTNIPSWNGTSNPGGAFGAAYANEYGNRLHFGLHIVGNGAQFSISELSFTATSSDLTNSLGFAFPNGYGYGAGYVGLSYGADGIKGTADDQLITGGSSDQLVNELFGRGSGNAWEVDDSSGNAQQQQLAIDMGAQQIWAANNSQPFTFTGTYALIDGSTTLASGSGQVTFDQAVAPLPSPALASLGLLGILAVRKLRSARAVA
jgi:hypothetical protein